MFAFLMPTKSALDLAKAMEDYPYRGPVNDRLITLLRAPPRPDGTVLCEVSGPDKAVLAWWSTAFADQAWAPVLAEALSEGCNI